MASNLPIPATSPRDWRMTFFQWYSIPVSLIWCGLFCGAAWLITKRGGDFWFAAMFVIAGCFPVARLFFLRKVVLDVDAASHRFQYSSRIWWGVWNTTHTLDTAEIVAVVYQTTIRTTGDESSATAKLLLRKQDGTDHTLFPYGTASYHHESAHHRGSIEWVPAGNGPLRLKKTGHTIAEALGVPYQEEELQR